MQDINSTKNEEISFPPEAVSIIREIVHNYGFEKIEEELLIEMGKIEDFKEKEKIFESLPGRQLARVTKEAAEGKITLQDVFSILQKNLKISEETAKRLSKELKERVISLAQRTAEKAEAKQILFKEKDKLAMPPQTSEIEPPIKQKSKASKEDIYREPIG